MGREVRRVPKDWEHPRDDFGNDIPLHDEVYEDIALRWVEHCIAWENGTHEDCEEHKAEYPFWWEWDDGPPDRESYRPIYTSPPTHYQMYETVSEGTPVSPVFASKDELADWLVEEKGHTREAAEAFVDDGWAPSFVFTPRTGLISGVDAADPNIMPRKTEDANR